MESENGFHFRNLRYAAKFLVTRVTNEIKGVSRLLRCDSTTNCKTTAKRQKLKRRETRVECKAEKWTFDIYKEAEGVSLIMHQTTIPITKS